VEILVLGARGGLGSLICAELAARGHAARTVTREVARDGAALADAARGAGAIVNCAGASVAMGLGKGWRGYGAVDVPIGLAAVAAARANDIRMVYVGVAHPPALARCAYVAAHERVAAAMRDLDGVVVRATGFYSAYAALLPMAKKGRLVDIGSGATKTNPIDECDLAAIVAEAVKGDGPRDLDAGGPEVMTRREIFERVGAAAAGLDGRVKITAVPVWLAAAGAAMFRVFHPRMGQFAKFAVLLAKHDAIAPSLGTRTFDDYLSRLTVDAGTGARSLRAV
jgi:NADH dehydrogenase